MLAAIVVPSGEEGTSSRPAVVEPQSGILLASPLTEIGVHDAEFLVVSDRPTVELMAVIPEDKKPALEIDVVLGSPSYSILDGEDGPARSLSAVPHRTTIQKYKPEEISARKRTFLFLLACTHVLLASGIVFGWTALRPVTLGP